MRLITLVLAAALLAACASTEMRAYIGRPISDVLLDYGPPEQVIDLPDGRKAYQFRWGGGAYVVPGQSHATAITTGNVTTVTHTGAPSVVGYSEGCLISFIASGDVVQEIRPPRELTC